MFHHDNIKTDKKINVYLQIAQGKYNREKHNTTNNCHWLENRQTKMKKLIQTEIISNLEHIDN